MQRNVHLVLDFNFTVYFPAPTFDHSLTASISKRKSCEINSNPLFGQIKIVRLECQPAGWLRSALRRLDVTTRTSKDKLRTDDEGVLI